MRKIVPSFIIAAALSAAFAAISVHAQTAAPAPAAVPAAPAAAVAYSVESTGLGAMLDDPAAKEVLERYIPALVSSPQIAMARSMTLKQLQQYAADTLTDETLGKIQYDLSKLPLKL